MTDWKPIATAPKDGTEVLIYEQRGDQHIRQVAKYVESFKMKDGVWQPAEWNWTEAHGEGYAIYEPTHWAPLPEPPASPSDRTNGMSDVEHDAREKALRQYEAARAATEATSAVSTAMIAMAAAPMIGVGLGAIILLIILALNPPS